MSNSSDQPGLVGSHASYVKGVAVGAVGTITGSQEWTQAGEQQKAAAIQDMKAASADRDAQHDGYGKAEELAGKVTGCVGMQEEGAASKVR